MMHGEACMIRSFKDKITEKVADAQSPKGFPADLAQEAPFAN